MIVVLFIIHMFIAVALIGVVLLQKSEGGALGMGGGGMSGFMTGRSTANLLTRTTAILAAAFMVTSILLVVLSHVSQAPRSIVDEPVSGPSAPFAPAAPAPTTPATGGLPVVPGGLPAGPAGGPAAPTAPTTPTAPAAPAEPSAPLAK